MSFIVAMSSLVRDWLTAGTHADLRMAVALALTEEVLTSASDLRSAIEPLATRARGPFMTMWRDRLEVEQQHRATYMRAVD